MTTLRLDAVSVDLDAARVIDELTLHCKSGTLVGLLGPNGSGKSTALKTVYRAIAPAAGRVLLDQVDVLQGMTTRQAARRIAAMTQEAPGDFEFTVLELIATGLTPHKRSWTPTTDLDRALLARTLDLVGMTHTAHRPFGTLSGGEKQRVMLARALVQRPDVLILDEPTNHLDISTQLALLDLIRETGVTALIALHDLNLAAAYCHRLHLMSEGRLVASGTPHEVLTPDRLAQVYSVQAHCSTNPITGRLHLAFGPLAPRASADRASRLDH